jgi:hypothetical protein
MDMNYRYAKETNPPNWNTTNSSDTFPHTLRHDSMRISQMGGFEKKGSEIIVENNHKYILKVSISVL